MVLFSVYFFTIFAFKKTDQPAIPIICFMWVFVSCLFLSAILVMNDDQLEIKIMSQGIDVCSGRSATNSECYGRQISNVDTIILIDNDEFGNERFSIGYYFIGHGLVSLVLGISHVLRRLGGGSN